MDVERQYADLIARALTDETFRLALIKDPAATLSAAGVEAMPNMEYEVVQSTPTKVYIVVPASSLLDDELLASAAGGSTASSAATAGTFLCVCLPGSASTVSSAGSAG